MQPKELDAYVEMRLEHWGKWFSRMDYGLGYPKVCTVATLMQDGGARGTGPKYPPSNIEAEEIEEHVKNLFMFKSKEAAEALRLRYFNPDRQDMALAQSLNPPVSLRTFSARLENGRDWIKSALCTTVTIKKKAA